MNEIAGNHMIDSDKVRSHLVRSFLDLTEAHVDVSET